MIEAIVRSLEDGEWHTLSEVKKGFNLTEDQCNRVVSFLRRHGLADLDAKSERIRLDIGLLELPL